MAAAMETRVRKACLVSHYHTNNSREVSIHTALLVARGRVLLAQDELCLRVEALVGLAGLLHQGRAVVVQAQAVAVAPAVAGDRLPLLVCARKGESERVREGQRDCRSVCECVRVCVCVCSLSG